jgi:hypothetical protein
MPGEYSALPSDAGWSSLVARRAHNPKVVGSNPASATNRYCDNGIKNVLDSMKEKVLYGRGVEQPGSSSGS